MASLLRPIALHCIRAWTVVVLLGKVKIAQAASCIFCGEASIVLGIHRVVSDVPAYYDRKYSFHGGSCSIVMRLLPDSATC